MEKAQDDSLQRQRQSNNYQNDAAIQTFLNDCRGYNSMGLDNVAKSGSDRSQMAYIFIQKNK